MSYALKTTLNYCYFERYPVHGVTVVGLIADHGSGSLELEAGAVAAKQRGRGRGWGIERVSVGSKM